MSLLFTKLSITALTVLCLFFTPVFSIAQISTISEAEKEVKIAEKDTNDLRPYCHAVFKLKAAYRLFLNWSFLLEGEQCPACRFGNDSLDLIEKKEVLKDIDRLDSLKNAGQLVNFRKERLKLKELRLSNFYFGFDDLALQLFSKGKLKSAASYSQLGFKYWKNVNDTTSAAFINRAVKVARDLIGANNDVQAIQLLTPILPLARQKNAQLATLSKRRLTESSEEKDEINADVYLGLLLQNLGEAYRKTNSWDKADLFLKEAIALLEPLSKKYKLYDGEDSTYTLDRHSALRTVSYNIYTTILSLESLYESQSRFDDALDLINQQIKNIKKDDPYFKLFYETKLGVLNRKFDFKGYKQTIEEARRDSINIGETPNKMELFVSGRIEEIMKIDEVTRLKYKKIFGEASDFHIAYLDIYASSLMILGNYGASKSVLDSAYTLAQNKEIALSTRVGILSGYAFLAQRMGQNERALTYQKACFEEQKKQLHPLSTKMAKEWSSLADSYLANQMLDSAAHCLRQALTIYEKTIGKEHFDYNNVLKQLIQVSYEKKQYAEATKLTNEMLENGKNYFDLMPIVALGQYNSVIPIFIANRDVVKAKDHQQKAAQLDRTIFKDSSRLNFLKNQRYALQIADNQFDIPAIINYTKIWLSGIKPLIGRQITFLPDGEKTQFIQSLTTEFAAVASVLSRHTEGAKYLYDLALLQNGIALTDARSFQRRAWDLPEGATKNTALALVAAMKLLNNDNMAFDMRIQRNREADSLRTLLKNDKEGKKLFTTDWIETSYADIQKRLKPNEVAIEFLDFNYHTPTVPTDSTMYHALVLRNTGLPTMVKLCEEKELASALTNDYFKINNAYDVKNKELTKLIWQPIEKAKILRGGETIYYAPSGLLHRLSFAALPNLNDSLRLCDRYNLVQMNSTRDINTQSETPFNWPTTTAAFFGGIKYYADSAKIADANKQFQDAKARIRSFVLSDTACRINALTDETKPIDSLFRAKQSKTDTFRGINATEDAFRWLGTTRLAPHIIHLATHGNYETPDGNVKLTPQQSLHYNYLFMAGCERYLCDRKPSIKGMEDGILTAAEIAQMNLSATQLVVLSACQTGLGDIKGREGVYGLSRAFKLAGARYTLSSLWSVPDAETAEFMEVFYTQLLDNQTIPDAFAKTQKAMRKKYASNISAWAVWVLMR